MAATFASSSTSSSSSSVNKNLLAHKSRPSNAINNETLNSTSIKNGSCNYPPYPVHANKVPKSNALSFTNDQRNTNVMSQIRFNIDQLVWAKISNHPWWPCKISRENPLDINSPHFKLMSKSFFVEKKQIRK